MLGQETVVLVGVGHLVVLQVEEETLIVIAHLQTQPTAQILLRVLVAQLDRVMVVELAPAK